LLPELLVHARGGFAASKQGEDDEDETGAGTIGDDDYTARRRRSEFALSILTNLSCNTEVRALLNILLQ
jgi:hypothetical protein